MSKDTDLLKSLKRAYRLGLMAVVLVLMTSVFILYYMIDPSLSALQTTPEVAAIEVADDPNKIEDGIHVRTGLVDGEGLMVVVNNCTNCHSAKLVTQNRMNEERWNTTIKWMQETQNLWDLGENQAIIVNYLTTNYPPEKKGRRENLSDITWYELEN